MTMAHPLTHNEIFMVSPINAILEGLYETPLTIAELKQHGDFGIGTFNDLNGELILLNGIAYRFDVDGLVHMVNDEEKTPFAAACFFEPFSDEEIQSPLDYSAFSHFLERCLPSPNLLYAIRVEGRFSRIRTRSVPRTENYTPLVEATAFQKELLLENVEGTLVGFHTPKFMPSINVPGYHFHFISKDCRYGGHLLECTLSCGRLSLQICSRLLLNMPMTLDYLSVDFNRDAREDLEKAER
ncbi:MAG: acetolactate decarboxylase [Deltaproteobacteria bacterium]|nr:acetolactate decarboxylase [Deltaproteobacteria bacterium]